MHTLGLGHKAVQHFLLRSLPYADGLRYSATSAAQSNTPTQIIHVGDGPSTTRGWLSSFLNYLFTTYFVQITTGIPLKILSLIENFRIKNWDWWCFSVFRDFWKLKFSRFVFIFIFFPFFFFTEFNRLSYFKFFSWLLHRISLRVNSINKWGILFKFNKNKKKPQIRWRPAQKPVTIAHRDRAGGGGGVRLFFYYFMCIYAYVYILTKKK